MKKTILLSFSAILLLLSINSCKKCYDCEKKCGFCQMNGQTVTACNGDAILGGADIAAWKGTLEAGGWTCQYTDPETEETCEASAKDDYEDGGYDCVSK